MAFSFLPFGIIPGRPPFTLHEKSRPGPRSTILTVFFLDTLRSGSSLAEIDDRRHLGTDSAEGPGRNI